MKILYIANIRMPTERAHGAQIVAMCSALSRAGHAVTLLVPNRRTHITESVSEYYGVSEEFSISRVPVFDTVAWGRIGFLLEQISFALSALCHSIINRYDVVYGRDEFPLLLQALTMRTLVWETHLPRFGAHITILARRAHIVAISGGLREWYVSHGIPYQKIMVAHDGYDPRMFQNHRTRDEARTALNLPKDAYIPMYIGALEEWKGFRTFLNASALCPDMVFAIVGGGEAILTKLRVEYPHVRFLGERPYRELAHHQQAADVLVVPNTATDPVSAHFTSPLKVFAHMTSGVPIIASSVPSIQEILSEDMADLIPPDDPEALQKAIRRSKDDREQALKMASVAKEAVTSYSWDTRASNIIQWVLQSRSGGKDLLA